jgi:Skp family chaperone for outer membrane proteins
MRKSIVVAVGLLFAAVFAVSAFAQVGAAQTPAAGRVGLIDTSAFLDDKPGTGIPKFKTAVTSVNAEFKIVNDELKGLATQYQTKVDEFNKLKNSTAPVADLEKRASDIQDLETLIKRKQEDANQKYERRMGQVVGPIQNDIGKAMSDFAKQKGYAVLFDVQTLYQAKITFIYDDRYDVTKEFIAFYNSRQPGAATAAATTATPPVKP